MADTKGKTVEKSYFEVMRLCCSSEVGLVENILKSLDGVHDVRVIVPTKTVIVIHDTLLVSSLQIVKALNQGRLEASLRVNGKGNKYRNKWPSPYVVASGLLLLVSLFKFVYHPLRWVALGAVAAGVYPILMRAFASLRNYRLDTNCLMLTAVAGTIAMNDYVEAGVIVFLFTIAEWLETRASHKARAVMSSLMSIAPQRAVIAETGEEVDVDKVKLNTVVVVKGGEVIPIDGIVVDGSCEVDEKTLTGESFPVPKQIDSTVWAGTINVNGYIKVKTTVLAEDCVVAKMARLVEDAQNSKSKTQRFIDNFAQYYTPAVIIISAAIAVVPLVSKVHNRNKWFHLALVVLVSACPCALILSTPVATFCALTKAATAGLLIKGGDYIETLAKVKTVAFDKTGTITRGEFVVIDFQSLSHGVNLEELLYWVSSIESKSSHPMAAALVDYAGSLSVQSKPENVVEFINFPGEGIYGKIDGRDVYIGNRKIALRAGSGTVPTLEPERSCGKTIGYVYSGANPAGIFTLSDACRTGVSEALRDLKLLGIRTAMLTGDSEAAALYAQDQLVDGVEVVHSELLPQDKARIIEELKKEGPTAMVGDGMNDAPALATADIGISMGISGSALAMETGHVILMSNDLRKVPKVIRLARKAHRKVIENVVLSIMPKAAILALAIAGHPLVWAAVLADVGTCLLVILNSMLLLKHQRSTNDGAGKCCKPLVGQNNQNVFNQDCCNQTSQPSSNSCCTNSKCTDEAPRQQKKEVQEASPNSCCTNSKCTDEAPRQQKKEVQEAKPCCGGGYSAKQKEEVSNLCGSVSSRRHHLESSIRHDSQIQCCKPSVVQNNQNVLNQDCCSQNVNASKCRTSQPTSKSCCTKNKRTDAAPRQQEKEIQEAKPCCGGGYSANRKEELGNSCGSGCQIPVENQGRSLGQAVDECCRNSSNADDIGMDIHEDGQKCCEETKTSKNGCRKSLEHGEKDGCSKSYTKECCGSKIGQLATGYVAIDIYDTETKGSRNSCNKKLENGEKDDCCKSYAKECCGSEGEMNSSRSGCHKSMELKEKEKDDCCKSYMKECCRRRRGQFATGFAKSVSGINIIN